MSYVFGDAARAEERRRLRSLEDIFDPATRRGLTASGLRAGHRCLEIGAGAGSIASWMADIVGPNGHTTAVDLDVGFLQDSRLDVRAGDIRVLDFPTQSFDFIHARYVLVHIPEYRDVLGRLWSWLKPGGTLFLEEPDFTAARTWSSDTGAPSFERVHRAIVRMYEAKGSEPACGVTLLEPLTALRPSNLHVENDAPVVPGGHPIAALMRASAEALAEKYIATGEASPADLASYRALTQNPAVWAIYYATARTIARR